MHTSDRAGTQSLAHNQLHFAWPQGHCCTEDNAAEDLGPVSGKGTGKAGLHAIASAPEEPAKLTDGQHHWAMRCRDASLGIEHIAAEPLLCVLVILHKLAIHTLAGVEHIPDKCLLCHLQHDAEAPV